MAVKYMLFDCDGTLYPAELEPVFKDAAVLSMACYLSRKLRLPIDEVYAKRMQLFVKYGVESTCYAFCKEYSLNYDEFMRGAYDNIEPLQLGLRCSLELNRLLAALPCQKSIFTNNAAAFARKVLTALGIESQFEHVIGAREIDFELKPSRKAFEKALQLTSYKAEETLFIDNDLKCLETAKAMGMKTILVSRSSKNCEFADFIVSELREIENLFEGGLLV